MSSVESLPCFYIVVADPSMNVHVEPDIASTVVRYINKGVVIFVEASAVDAKENKWLKGPDGWLMECEQASVYYSRKIPALVPYDTSKLVNVVGNNFDSPLSIYSQLLAQPALPHQSSSAKKSKEKVTIDWTKRYNACSDSDEDINLGDDDEDGDSLEQMMKLQSKLSKLNEGLVMCQQTLSNIIETKLQSATKSSKKSDSGLRLYNPEDLDFVQGTDSNTLTHHEIRSMGSASPNLVNDATIGGASTEDTSRINSCDPINTGVPTGGADAGKDTEGSPDSSQKSMRELRAKYFEKINSP